MYACIKTCRHKHVCTWISCLFLCGKFQVESWALSLVAVSSLTHDHTCLTIVVQKLAPCHSSVQTGQQLDYGSREMWRRHQPDDVVFFSCHVFLPPISAGCVLFVVWNTRCVKPCLERGNPFSRPPETWALRLDAVSSKRYFEWSIFIHRGYVSPVYRSSPIEEIPQLT